jgi:hypothetical protein
MVLATTLIMIVNMAFRIPFGFQGPVLALFVSRESTQATVKSVFTMFSGILLGAIFVLVTAPVFTINPILHFIWVGVALFIVFFALSTVNNYIGVLMFALVIVVALPLWDRPVTAETNVIDTLWLVWESVVGVGVTMGVELAFAHLRPGDNVIFTVTDRLAAVEGVLRCYAKGEPVNAYAQRQIGRYAMLGTSLARRYSARSGFNLPYVAQRRASRSLQFGPTSATSRRQGNWLTRLRNCEASSSIDRRQRLLVSGVEAQKRPACPCWGNWSRRSRLSHRSSQLRP